MRAITTTPEQKRDYHRRRAASLSAVRGMGGPRWDTLTLAQYRTLEPTLARPLTDDPIGIKRQVIEVGMRSGLADW